MDIRKSRIAWIILFLVCICVAMLIFIVLSEKELWVDMKLTTFIHTIIPNSLHSFFERITHLGDKIVLGFIAILFIVWLAWKQKNVLAIVTFVLCVGVGNEASKWLKDLIARPRPVGSMEAGSSFPSGHAMVSLLLYMFIAHILAKQCKTVAAKMVLAGIAVLLVVFIGISRIVLGVHYPTDIIGGYLIGGIWLYVWIYIYETFRERMQEKKNRQIL